MKLPKPVSQGPVGIPQRRRKSGLRTASDGLQDEFLERQRRLSAEPLRCFPEVVGDVPAPLRRLHRILARAAGGSLPATSRFDRGFLGALRAVFKLAERDEVPRLLDVRVDGQRKFFLLHGHVNRLVLAGLQNHDDPLALLLAYGPMASRHGLVFFAGSKLWCTGTRATPPTEWVEDLAARAEMVFSPEGDDWTCPHRDRARMAYRILDGPALLACPACAAPLVALLHDRILHGKRPARPVTFHVRMPDGKSLDVPDTLADAHRAGRLDATGVLEKTVTRLAGSSLVAGGRVFATADELVAALGLDAWEQDAARVLLAGGHHGPSMAASDVLGAHADRLPEAVRTILGPDGDAWLERQNLSDVRVVLRLAEEERRRRDERARLPALPAGGPLARWVDGFVRDVRVMDRADVLRRVRKEIPASPHPGHLAAFLLAAGLVAPTDRSFSRDQWEAGQAWAVLARRVLDAEPDAYVDAVRTYLKDTGSGESLG